MAEDPPSETQDGSDGHVAVNGESATTDAVEAQDEQTVFQLDITLPHEPFTTSIMCSNHEQVQDIRQSIVDLPYSFQYSCFHLEHHGRKINDFVELSEVPGIAQDPQAVLVQDPYNDSQARIHFVRIRELIGASGDQIDHVRGLKAGLSLHDSVATKYKTPSTTTSPGTDDLSLYDPSPLFRAEARLSTLVLPYTEPPPKTVKSLSLSHWNPPPYHFRAQGQLLYILVTTLEGEQYHITSHVTGFYVNNCSNHKFDPSPRSVPKAQSAHSLLSLLQHISLSFDAAFTKLQEYNSHKDPLTAYQVSNAIPSSPWLVSPDATSLSAHQADITRSQEAYLLAGSETAETLRDWNEEFQATRELPKETVQDRVFRERLTSKLFAEYNAAAVKGAVLVARGDIAPLNPTEAPDAHIFVYNNVFYSFGADGVGTYAADGGDEAARAATGKDVRGVQTVNQLDIPGLFTPGTVVVDYLGKRMVGQSIVPGIFKQREPGEHQIDYGGVEGKDVVAENEAFKAPFAELSKSLRVKKHPVWDKEKVRHDLEGSIETKGLLGTDGRKYVLDLYRMTPLDVEWLDRHKPSDGSSDGETYPHRMAVLRPELIESYYRFKLRSFIQKELSDRRAAKHVAPSKALNETKDVKNTDRNGEIEQDQEQERIDISSFDLTFNPDVCCGQQPQTEEERAEWAADEQQVRDACRYLTHDVLPQLVNDIEQGQVGFPMDGSSLSNLLHKRGINLRYLGDVAKLADSDKPRLQALKILLSREMVSRAFKHIANAHLRNTSAVFAHSCIAHLLSCLLGAEKEPKAYIDKSIRALYNNANYTFESVTPGSLKVEIIRQVKSRFSFDVHSLYEAGQEVQILREICLKLGLQLEVGRFKLGEAFANRAASPDVNGQADGHDTNGKKKKKPTNGASQKPRERQAVFEPEDIVNLLPLIKEASPRSALAEEALEAARNSIAQDQKELGQELLLESLSLYEQIYGILHPEVARAYYSLSTIYYSLDEKNAAMELARKAVIIFERTLGVDHAETVLGYLNLGLFEHAGGNTPLALAYVRHALDLWKIIYGPRHPDSIMTINNAAVMLQSIKRYHESRLWFEVSLDICHEVSGNHSVNTATLLFQYAQSLAFDRDSKGAVTRMREAFTMFRDEFGPEDRNTKEAETWLESLTQSAVSVARHAKDVESRRLLIRPRAPTTAVSPISGQPAAVPATPPSRSDSISHKATEGRDDGRSIDELLKYINAGSSEGKVKTGKRKTVHPRRR